MDQSSGDSGSWRSGEPSLMETSLTLDSDGSRIAHARRLASDFLIKVREAHSVPVLTATVEIAQLIVSELATNARKYAPGPAVLHLRFIGGMLEIELRDSSPVLPASRAPNPERVGQHGLEIVTSLARRVTIEATPLGKRVIAVIAIGES
ncbi:ATP-binding protein [Streptomyces sp. NPDC055056]